MRTEYMIRYGNPDPEVKDSEAWDHSAPFRFANRDLAVDYLADYFDNWSKTDTCEACVERSAEVRDYLRSCRANGTPVDWGQVEVEGDWYWIVPVSVAGR